MFMPNVAIIRALINLPHSTLLLRPGDAGWLCVRSGRVGGTLSPGLGGVLQPSHQLLAVHQVCQDGRHKSCCGGPGWDALCYW